MKPNALLVGLFNTTPDTLAQKQHDVLQAEVVKFLQHVVDRLNLGQYSDVAACLAYSPAGGSSGCGNQYICFNDIMKPLFPEQYHNGRDHNGGWDLGDVIEKLVALKASAGIKKTTKEG